MIRPLRQLHRRTLCALGIFLPIAFGTGLAVRTPVPVMPGFPPGLFLAPPATTKTDWYRTNLFSKFAITVRLLRDSPSNPHAAVAFSAERDFLQPDLLVYWLPGSPVLAGALPDSATLLGEFDAQSLPLPSEATSRAGLFVLYSLADNKIVDVSRAAILGDLTP